MVWGRVLSELVYTSFHRGSNGEHLPVQQDTIGVMEDIDWDPNERFYAH